MPVKDTFFFVNSAKYNLTPLTESHAFLMERPEHHGTQACPLCNLQTDGLKTEAWKHYAQNHIDHTDLF